MRLECKTTGNKSYSLKVADLKKIQMEAVMGGEDWAFQIEFQGQAGQNKKLAVIETAIWEELSGNKLICPFVLTDKKSVTLRYDELGSMTEIVWNVDGVTTKYAVLPWWQYIALREERP